MSIFSQEEIRDIIIAVVTLTVIFANPDFTLAHFAQSLVIVLLAFLLHEFAHKFAARRYGCIAFFKMWPFGILIGIVFMILGFKIAAPGAVVIYPYRFGRWKHERRNITIREMGIISASGVAVNLIIALVAVGIPISFFAQLATINAFLAFFNLVPIKPLDGSKIFTWKPWFWFFMQLVSVLLLISPLLLRVAA